MPGPRLQVTVKRCEVLGAMMMEPMVTDVCDADPKRLDGKEEEPRTHQGDLEASEGQGRT